jgi:hypothetical protein
MIVGGLRNSREESMMNHEESGYGKSRSVISVRKMDDISCVIFHIFRYIDIFVIEMINVLPDKRRF